MAHALTQFGLKEGSSFVWAAPPWLDSLLGKDRDVGVGCFFCIFCGGVVVLLFLVQIFLCVGIFHGKGFNEAIVFAFLYVFVVE